MRVIGMLGGMSWESTLAYYRLANELVREQLGGFHSAKILLDSVDFAEIETLQTSGRWEEAGVLLALRAKALQAAGADLLMLCTNTMHKVAPQIENAISIPFIHIADATAAAIKEKCLTTDANPVIALLGTKFTMEQDFLRSRLESHGLEIIVPDTLGKQVVHDIIYQELVHGVIRDSSRTAYIEVINQLYATGACGVILGCTEIELLVSENDSPIPVFPTTSIHVKAAVAAALQ